MNFIQILILILMLNSCYAQTKKPTIQTQKQGNMQITEEEWKKMLTPEQFDVLRNKGTERAFTGKYWNHKENGQYKCSGCGVVLFTSDTKFDSGCGWPSFNKPADNKIVKENIDNSFGMKRVEVVCSNCGGHLGHVFEDAPEQPTGLRYCINSISIEFQADTTVKK